MRGARTRLTALAACALALSPAAVSAQPGPAPAHRPRGLTVDASVPGRATISWRPVPGAERYDLRWCTPAPCEPNSWQVARWGTEKTTATIRGAAWPASNRYAFDVVARGGGERSAPSRVRVWRPEDAEPFERWPAGERRPPVWSQLGPSCAGYAWATALAAEAAIAEGRDRYRLFDGRAIYRPSAEPGGGAYPSNIAEWLRQNGSPDLRTGTRWWVAEWSSLPDPTDHDAVRAALAEGPLVVSTRLNRQFDAGGPNPIDWREGEWVDSETHALVAYRAGRRQVWLHNSWGLGAARHRRGTWRVTWAYWDHYVYDAIRSTATSSGPGQGPGPATPARAWGMPAPR